MNLPDIRTIKDINELLTKRYIESEIFDFKPNSDDLKWDICAMANNDGGGQLILGIDEDKNECMNYLLGFKKSGFKQGTEDKVNQQIGNNLYEVEPTPKIDPTFIYELDRQTFYVVVQVHGENINKPYFLRGTWQCYMRVGNSSKPASRSIILNLLNNFLERRNSVQRLRVITNFLKESLKSTVEEISIHRVS
jgi:predicted HTH transcriptional regulator